MRYNQKNVIETVVNHQGGTAIKYEPKLELIGILFNDFGKTYHETLGEREQRFSKLIKEIAKTDLEFVAKALIYTRSVIGQRSATHFGSVVLAPLLSGNPIAKNFFTKRIRNKNQGGIVYRLDDMLEIIAAYQSLNPGKPLPNSMKKGFKQVLEVADVYELAKYQSKTHNVSLVDVVNLVHPKPNKSKQQAFKDLMSGNLKQFNTVEDKNTNAGKVISEKVKSGEITQLQAEVEIVQAKSENFEELIDGKKIGYLALLRNLRNILKIEDLKLIKKASVLLTDEVFIKKSLVFPHQIDLALELLLKEFPTSALKDISVALGLAYELSIPNLTELFTHGRTAVVFDTSGSMFGGWGTTKKPIDKAALIGATLAKGIGADLYQFGSECEEVKYNPLDSVNTIKNIALAQEGRVGHGTSFSSIFDTLMKNGKYDRIFIISDMQGGDSIVSRGTFQNYQHKFGTPYIYSIDIVGHNSTMFKPNNKLIQLFGYSAEIYEMVKKAEIDPKVILREIENIVI